MLEASKFSNTYIREYFHCENFQEQRVVKKKSDNGRFRERQSELELRTEAPKPIPE